MLWFGQMARWVKWLGVAGEVTGQGRAGWWFYRDWRQEEVAGSPLKTEFTPEPPPLTAHPSTHRWVASHPLPCTATRTGGQRRHGVL